MNSIPKLNTTFHSYVIPYYNIIFDKTMGVDITVITNLSTIQYNTELPNFSVNTNLSCIHLACGIDVVTHTSPHNTPDNPHSPLSQSNSGYRDTT